MGSDTLVMGFATGYKVEQLVPFVLSLRQHHDGAVWLFVSDDPDVHAFLDSFQISWTRVDPASSSLHPFMLRLQYCYDALRQTQQRFSHVLTCDVRDVFFQGNPFAQAPDARLIYFIESTAENPSTLSEAHNQHWIKTAFGDDIFRKLADKPILCAGTIMGSHDGMLDYLAAANRLIAEFSPEACRVAGLDQAILNRLAYEGTIAGTKFCPNGQVAANLCGMTREMVRWDFAEQMAICDNHRPAIVHQYDRHPALDGIITRRYRKAWRALAAFRERGGLGAALSAVVVASPDQFWFPRDETPSVVTGAPPDSGTNLLTIRPAPSPADGLSWGPPDLSLFTIASANYTAWTITLLESARRYEPTAERFVFALDPLPDGAIDPSLATVVPIEALGFPELDAARFAYSAFEIANAIKPYAFRWLFRERPGRPAILFDSDICLLAPLESVRAGLEAGAELILTPHLDSPLSDGKQPADIDVIRSGVNNMGFICARPSAQTEAFMGWWADRLARDCRVALDEGIFVDQSWAALAPSFVNRTLLLRDPGTNVAYWNLLDRPLSCDSGGWRAAGSPLSFFHFSGLQLDPPLLSRHQNRLSPADVGRADALMTSYIAALEANGYNRFGPLPYRYDSYADGRPIHTGHRLYFRNHLRDEGIPSQSPFGLDQPFWHGAAPEIAQDAPLVITRQMVAVWLSEPELKRAFPLHHPNGRLGFAEWATQYPESGVGPLIAHQGYGGAGSSLIQLTNENRALQHEIDAMRHSTSWRLTAPIRRLATLLHGRGVRSTA